MFTWQMEFSSGSSTEQGTDVHPDGYQGGGLTVLQDGTLLES